MRKQHVSGYLTAILLAAMIIAFGGVVQASSGSTSAQAAKKNDTLVVYFTMPERDGVDAVSGASRVVVNSKVVGSTRRVANWIRNEVGGDITSIRTKKIYPADHASLVDEAQTELEENARPELASRIRNLDQYDTIFIGYPIWWADLPMPVYTFFEEYDFSGKTIIPFTTHGGSGFSGTIGIIAELEPEANVIRDGLSISRDDVSRAKGDVLSWVRELDY